MRIVIQVCNAYALEEYVYASGAPPDLSSKGYLRLSSERFNLQSDCIIAFNISEQGLSLDRNDSDAYYKRPDEETGNENLISKNMTCHLVTKAGEELEMNVYFTERGRLRFYLAGKKETVTLGSGPGRTLCLIDNERLSGLHLILRDRDGTGILNVKSQSGCYLNGAFLGQMSTQVLRYGDIITTAGIRLIWLAGQIGFETFNEEELSLIRLPECDLPCEAALTGSKEDFIPAVRNILREDNTPVELDPPPQAPAFNRQPAYMAVGPALTMAIPMCLGSGLYIYASKRSGFAGSAMFMYTGLITALASAILGAMWAVAGLRQNRKTESREAVLRIRAYTSYINVCRKQIEDKYRHNRNVMLRNSPAVQEILSGSCGSLILNRRAGDEELFKYRLGTGRCRFEVEIKIPREKFSLKADELNTLPVRLKEKYREIDDVPICTDLASDRIQGYVGRDRGELERLFVNIAMHIASTTGPELIRMIFLFSGRVITEDTVRIMRWLPQAQGDDEHYVCTEREREDELLCSLEALIKAGERGITRWIIFTDDHRKLPASVMDREDVSVLIFSDDYGTLPGECTCIIQNDISFRGMLRPGSYEKRVDICFDHIPDRDADVYVRKIAGLCRYIKKEVLPIPGLVTFPMLYNKSRIGEEDIARSWRVNNTLNSIRAPIGMAADSRVLSLDLHEKAHGPHGLIAGMTGSGKSELLQTLILSMALRYPPWEIGFFLIDYKGGGMASLFYGLPHLVGSISNLSGNVTDRALMSIRSENERRQRLFLEAGVNSIRDYGRLFHEGMISSPLPHIIIIIDEFAELKRGQPEFMKELISVAQVGRSLGVHLILATQKPAGTVDDNIFSNSRFRICLRVQDKQDSNDMLHRPDAAYIADPGRAFLQVGNDELFEEFQSGYSMEPYTDENKDTAICLLDRDGRRMDVQGRAQKKEGAKTHFSVLMECIGKCTRREGGYKVRRLWLPELPAGLVFEGEKEHTSGDKGALIGRYDDPVNRVQDDLRIEITAAGHIALCGSPRSGKSTFLQTFLLSSLLNAGTFPIDIYIVDHDKGLLSCFRDSYSVGAYINEDMSDRLENLFCLLKEIIERRRNKWEGTGFANRVGVDDKGERENALLLVLDNYGAFREKTDGEYDGIMQELIKSGETYGVFVILTGNLIGNSDIPQRLFENCRNGICLRMNDRYQYGECLRQTRVPLMPSDHPGRGLAYVEGRILEFQTGVYYTDDDIKRSERIKQEICRLNETYPERRAEQVPYIPKEPVLSDLYRAIVKEDPAEGKIPIGFDKSSARPFMLDVYKSPCVLFAGARGSGKTNACKVVMHYALKSGIRAGVADSIRKICEFYEDDPCGMIVCDGIDRAIDDFYRNDRDPDIEEVMVRLTEKPGSHIMVFSIPTAGHASVAGRRIYETIREKCRGVYLGGGLERQNVFDFSYMTYSEQCRNRPAGTATIVNPAAGERSGEVIIPVADAGGTETGI